MLRLELIEFSDGGGRVVTGNTSQHRKVAEERQVRCRKRRPIVDGNQLSRTLTFGFGQPYNARIHERDR